MTEVPKIRIVILNYNESQYTLDLIDQLHKQSFKSYEIVVVDNHSKKEEQQKLESISSAVKVVFSEKNLGYAGGNNLGLRYPSNFLLDYFLVLNNDLIIDDVDFISTLVYDLIALKSQNVVAASPIVNTISTGIPVEQQIQVRRLMPLFDTFLLNIPLFNFFTKKRKNYFLYKESMPFINKTMKCDTINGAAFLIEGDFLRKNEYLDEGTFLYYEEIILGKQIKLADKTCMLNGNTSVKHLQGVSTKSDSKSINVKMERYKYKSSLYFLKKYEKMNAIGSYAYIVFSEMTILVKKMIK